MLYFFTQLSTSKKVFMNLKNTFLIIIAGLIFMNCSTKEKQEDNFKYVTEQFADLRIQRYQVPGFEDLSLKQKKLVYYLYQAALYGRDMIYDQNYKHNLYIRRTLEGIVRTFNGDKSTPEFEKFLVYTKRVWFSNGVHHHYSNKKFIPEYVISDLEDEIECGLSNYGEEWNIEKEEQLKNIISRCDICISPEWLRNELEDLEWYSFDECPGYGYRAAADD